MKTLHVFAGILGALASLAAQLPAAAQADYPNKPLTMIVPFPAGGRTDLVGRIVAQELTKHIGRPVAVVNKPGASSVLGAREVAESPPDGYTLGFFSTSAVTAQYTVPTPIPLSNFELVAIVNTDPAAVAVQYGAPWKTLKDLIEDARKQAGKLRLGMIPGASAQIFAAGLENAAGIETIQVPFKGDSDGAIALAGGHIDIHVAVPVSYKSLEAAKKVRMLAVADSARSPLYGNLPTFKDNGVDLVIGAFHGVYVPRGTPQAIIDKLADALAKTMESRRNKPSPLRCDACCARRKSGLQHELTPMPLSASGGLMREIGISLQWLRFKSCGTKYRAIGSLPLSSLLPSHFPMPRLHSSDSAAVR
jgi:tripartite-type tricarboxylate transporter receptor subunit TctC